MTTFMTRANKQCLVYWAFSARDGYGGATFSTPVEIWGRWEDKQKMFTDNLGNQLISSSIVYLSQEVAANDWLFLGGLADIATSIDNTNPKNVASAQQIRATTKVPSLRANKFQRIAFLSDATSTR